MILSKIPLATFLMTCVAFYIVLTRYKKERKSAIILFLIGGIDCFFITVKNLNNIYYSLAKPMLNFIDVVIITSLIAMLMLAIYIVMTKKDKQPFGKLPPMQ